MERLGHTLSHEWHVAINQFTNGTDEAAFIAGNVNLFNNQHVRQEYHVDSYFFTLGAPTDNWNVKLISYWYSLWSHCRNGMWKGFVQVDISSAEDEIAEALLAQIEQENSIV